MSIDRGDPGVVVAVCDQCGERRMLEVEADATEVEVRAAIRALGWRVDEPERHKFAGASTFTRTWVAFAQDFCTDCRTDEPRPHPLFGSGRVARLAVDPLANDPVDEWPRALVFEAVGLRSACGHPPGDPMCPYCARGCPAGDTREAWRR